MTISVTDLGGGVSAGATSLTTTLSTNVPAGNLINVFAFGGASSGTGTVTDTAGNTYTLRESAHPNAVTTDGTLQVFECPNCLALSSGNTIKYTTGSGSAFIAMECVTGSGIVTSSPNDSGANNTATGSSATPSVTSGTPAGAGEVFYGVIANFNDVATPTQPSGWTGLTTQAQTSLTVASGYIINAGTGTEKYNPTGFTSSVWAALIVAYKPAASAVFVPRRAFDPSVLAWQPDPNAGFIGGAQPYAARQLAPGIPGQDVSPPPFRHPERTIQVNAATVAAWQPDVWPQAFLGGQQAYGTALLNPSITGVMASNPPFGVPSPAQPTWLDQWKADPWPSVFVGGQQPYAPHPNSPGIPGQDLDTPPFQHLERSAIAVTIKQAWQPDAWPVAVTGGRQPYDQSRLAPSITAVAVNNPPLGDPERWLVTAQIKGAQAWQPDPWPSVFLGAEQPYAPEVANPAALGITVSNPPISGGAASNLATLIRAWQPDAWPVDFVGGKQPYDQARLPAAISAVTTNNPPFGIASSNVTYLVSTWQPDPSLSVGTGAYQSLKLVPGQTTDPPPFRNQERSELSLAIKQAWQPDLWPFNFAGGAQPYTPRALSPGVPGQSHDAPPPHTGEQGELGSSIKVQWRDTPWPYVFIGADQPYEAHFPPIPSVAVIVNNPPFQNRGRTPEQAAAIVVQWQPDPWPSVLLGGKQAYAPRLLTPPSVDRPFVLHPERSAITASIKAQWQPDPWPFAELGGAQPYTLRQVSPGIPGRSIDNPPFQTQGKRPINIAITLAPWQPDPWPFDFLGGAQPYQQGAISPGVARALVSSGLGPPVGQFVFYFLSSAPGQLYPAYITAFDRSTSSATITYFPPGNQPLPVIGVFYDPSRQTPSSWSYQDPQDRYNETVPSVGQVVRYYDGTSMSPAIITAFDLDGNVELTAFPAGSGPILVSEVNYDYTGTNAVSWRYAEVETDFVETSGPRIGQIVAFISAIGVGYPAMITGVNKDGTVSLMGFAPGANVPLSGVPYSSQDTVPNRWQYRARRQ